MGPRVPFAPALLTLSPHITLHTYFISSRLLILLYVTCVTVNKAVKKKRNRGTEEQEAQRHRGTVDTERQRNRRQREEP